MTVDNSTPILFLIFNREDLTKEVFSVLQKLKPTKLYIAADGPRPHKEGEAERCAKTRAVVADIDWDCEVKRLYRDENMGCFKAVSGAITWFFENEEKGIILEDDCLPNMSFFNFCKQMLDLYAQDSRIMHVSGSNFDFGKKMGSADYYFSRQTPAWGWASWRRAWQMYRPHLEGLDNFIKEGRIHDVVTDGVVASHCIRAFRKTKSRMDTWDYQWYYTVMVNNGLSVSPSKNMVKNIGFTKDATHGAYINKKIINNPVEELEVKTHPDFFVPYVNNDNYQIKVVFEFSFLRRVKNKIIKTLFYRS